MPNRPIKLTPFHRMAQRLNAQFAQYNGWKVPEVYTSPEAEIDAARNSVVLADETPNGKFIIEGNQAEDALNAVFNQLPTLAINAGTIIGSNRVYRLRGDRFFISTPPEEAAAMEGKLSAAAKNSAQLLTVTDVTHGRAEIRVIGPNSQNLLSKLCGLDFQAATFPGSGIRGPGSGVEAFVFAGPRTPDPESRGFPDGTAKESSLAKTTQLIIRRDIGELPAFSIIGARSMGVYLWETIMEAGHEWGLVPMGCAALNLLEKSR